MAVFPGLSYQNGRWHTQATSNPWLDDKFRPFAIYDNYTDHNHATPEEYQVGFDVLGPQFFLPTQCIWKTSFNIPKRVSKTIAVVKGEGYDD